MMEEPSVAEKGLDPPTRAPLLAAVVCGLLFIAGTVAEVVKSGLPADLFFRDQASVMRAHPLTGVVATVGAVGFLMAATVALFAAALGPVDRERSAGGGWPRSRVFVLLLGAGSLVLGLDDLFLLHEDLLFRYLGIGEKVLIVAYGVGALAVAGSFRDQLHRGGLAALALTVVLLGTSVAVDASPLSPSWHWTYAIEDGPKLVGIACWLVYCGTAGASVLRERPGAARRP